MKVLIVHTRYRQPGGEDVVVEVQDAALSGLGHTVVRFERTNDDLDETRPIQAVGGAISTIWSRRGRRDLAATIAAERPDVVHVHNTFPALSPSVYAAANDAGVPVVQHLHNARLVCTNPNLIRNGMSCTKCIGRRLPWPGVAHRCYHDSVAHSAVAAAVQVTHRALGTWWRRVDLFLPVSAWLGNTLIEAGAIPRDKVQVCHSAVDPDPGVRPPLGSTDPNDAFVLFAGRLSPEKGLQTLLEAARAVPETRLLIAGDGPDRPRAESFIRDHELHHVELLGHLDRARILALLRSARAVVLPSLADALPMTMIEATAIGVPVIASSCGGIPEGVVEGETGYLVPPGDAGALARRLREVAADPSRMEAMGTAGRQLYEERFTADAFARRLLIAYETATANASAAGRQRGIGPLR